MSKLDFYRNLSDKIVSELEDKLPVVLWPLLLLLLIFTCALVLLYSASGCSMYPWAMKQLTFISIFSLLALLIRSINIMWFYDHAYTLYALCIMILIFTNIFGHNVMGAQRWIDLKYFSMQPSELAKVGVILALSKYFNDFSNSDGRIVSRLLFPIIISLLPFFLILFQPNLGTATILLFICAALFFINGIKKVFFLVPILIVLASSPFIWRYALHDYQKRRVITFLNPEKDILDSGYNIVQSKIAIGSGGIWGKGMCGGSQSRLNFLPEKHNDFIFTLLAEEYGLVGCIFVLFIYFLWIAYSYGVSNYSSLYFGKMVSVGFASMIFIHVFINVGMVSGILPVVGVPFPILSYGGSNAASTLLMFGIVLSVQKSESKRRFKKYIQSDTKN
ncbi:Rod shape-determining protein RodA [Candidatus Cyrtobacter comes]|uniref:Rod shape-determining protein RodA n=1 Tax=Candidatus Cyrtobacter comes TaxID=675776 RepID=A0ABU5L8Y0_9RICK|nr:rod shape-determining protein RodA [Candidatus Cyrtobacter comes]MDZ5762582.1 Rod shape-determining protein RodA [Candidatus Cyrtobacter comes]